jgi:hypothetical protein
LACKIIVRRLGFALMAGIVCFSPARAAESFQADLGPMPLDAASRTNIQGRGEATATVAGKTLNITGTFGGLTSPATEAHVYLSPVIGVPGPVLPIGLTITPANDGTLSGGTTLSDRQATALRAGRLYLMIASQNAPSGTLWGWLLPLHENVGPDVPQQGDWFQPHIGAPLRWHSSDAMGQR